MLNDLLIDKIRFAAVINENILDVEKKNLFKIKARLENTLKNYFPKDAFRVYKIYKQFFIEFNPTKFDWLGSRRENGNNLQMIPEEVLKELLDKLRPTIEEILPLERFNVVEINLTKNFQVENKAQDYLDMLLNTSPKGVHPVLFKSKSGQSVYFSYLKRDNKDKEYTGYNIIKFYDKIAELECKTGGNLSNIRLREKLSDAEKEIFEDKYNKSSNSINLEGTNLLRVEITYKRSQNLKKIANFFVKNIGGSINKPNPKNLSLNVVFDLLERNIFYSGLEQFYREELKKKIFYNNPNADNNKKKTNSYNTALKNLLLGNNLENIESEMYYLENILEAADMKNISGHLKSMGENIVRQQLYNELYNAIFNGIKIPPPEIDWNLYQLDSEELDFTEQPKEEEREQEEPNMMSDEEMDAAIDEIIEDSGF